LYRRTDERALRESGELDNRRSPSVLTSLGVRI
jgi:hypothetical protein